MSGNNTQITYPSSLFNEYTIAFEGGSIACILFGIYLVFAGTNISLLRKKRCRLLFAYTVFQLVVTTLYFAVSLYASPPQLLYIFNISGTFGPNALSPWPSVIVNVAFVLNTWASDAFLLYRCYNLCGKQRYAIMVPSLLYLATFGSSLAWLAVSSIPGAQYATWAVQVSGICYWSFSAAMNVCASSFICTRIWMHRQTIACTVGTPQTAFHHVWIIMALESALLYTIFVITALIAFVLNSPLENVFFPVVGTIQAIGPSLIIYRIARGISFETEYGGVASGNLHFTSTVHPHVVLRHGHDVSTGSDTMHVSTDDSIHKHDSGSFIHELKDSV